MSLPTIIDDVFAGPSHTRVLRALYGLPEGLLASTREIARRGGVSHPTASKVLRHLDGVGLVRARRSLSGVSYEIDDEHVLAALVRTLFEREEGLMNELVRFLADQIQAHAPLVTSAYLFGSVARGTSQTDSDVDVAVTCTRGNEEQTYEAMDNVQEAVRRRFGRRVDVIVGGGSLSSLKNTRRQGHRLWRTIEQEGVSVIKASNVQAS